jgi:hypothetical protein
MLFPLKREMYEVLNSRQRPQAATKTTHVSEMIATLRPDQLCRLNVASKSEI